VKIFISYSSHDDVAVRSLAADLQRARQQVWLDQDLGGGEVWWAEILEQIRACTVFVFALSNNSLYSTPCRTELDYAKELGLPILPVQIGEVSSYRTDPIFSMQFVEYRDTTKNSVIDLVSALHERAIRRAELPDPLPEPPPIPYEYLQRLGASIHGGAPLSPEAQAAMVFELRTALQEEEEYSVRDDIKSLLRALRGRRDVIYAIVRDIDSVLDQFTDAARGSEPSEAVQGENPAPAAVVQKPAPEDTARAVDAPAKKRPEAEHEVRSDATQVPFFQWMSRRTKFVIAAVTVSVVVAVAAAIIVGNQSSQGGGVTSPTSTAAASPTSTAAASPPSGTAASPPSSTKLRPSNTATNTFNRDATQRLLTLVPSGDQCAPDRPDAFDYGAVAKVRCSPGANQVRMLEYSLYSDQATLDNAFGRVAPVSWLLSCPGRGLSADWPQGQIECYHRGDMPYINWTINSQLVMGLVGGQGNAGVDPVYQWWSARYQ
jgi:serine/threonine kinase PknH